jgi:2-polyprenyl-6-methoxyphenol hydroxylase-like FAD-dependent oxidoreductase
MSEVNRYDVIIAGGGVAGVAVAASLGEFGYSVAIVEPGMDATRRLAGELIHPAGVNALDQLGLLATFHGAEASRIEGFSVSFGASADTGGVRLPYALLQGNGHRAFAMEHSLIRERVIAAAARLPWVTLLQQARVTGVDLGHNDHANVTVSSPAGEVRMRCRLLVAADGGSSAVSRLAGFAQTRRRISTLLGFLVKDLDLPDAGYGHAFLGGAGPVLAYQIARGTTRIMFDVPTLSDGATMLESCRASVRALPECIRDEVGAVIEAQRPIASASYSVAIREITRGCLLLVGDAAGCCHPLTATGLTVCTRDALLLRDALCDAHGDIPRALALHTRRRRCPQRTRLALAHALYEVFCGQTPELRLVRDGMRAYWRRSGKGRSVSIALVSTSERRLRVMLRELSKVILYGLGVRVAEAWKQGRFSPISQSRVLVGLSRVLLRHASEVMRTT